jgi:hypothetical protein
MLDTATPTTAPDSFADHSEAVGNITNPTTTTPRSKQDLLVLPISDHEWRVTDRRLAPNNAHSVLGVIERKASDLFEVLQLAPALAWRCHPSLDEATNSFLRMSRR